jgi:hypothetical protein
MGRKRRRRSGTLCVRTIRGHTQNTRTMIVQIAKVQPTKRGSSACDADKPDPYLDFNIVKSIAHSFVAHGASTSCPHCSGGGIGHR